MATSEPLSFQLMLRTHREAGATLGQLSWLAMWVGGWSIVVEILRSDKIAVRRYSSGAPLTKYKGPTR